MTFPLTPALAFTARISTITAQTLNAWRTAISQAIDGTGGGDYTPIAKLRIGGTFGLEIYGTGSAAWVRLSSRTVTLRCPLHIVGTSQAAVPSTGTDPDQVIQLSDVANVHALKTKAWNAAGSAYTWLSLGRPPDGNDLASVVVTTKGLMANNNPGTKATYQIIRWAPGTAYTVMSPATADAHTYAAGNWLTTAVDTTITVNATATIDSSNYEYALLVNHPGDGATQSSMYVYSMKASYTCTQLQIA